MESYKEKYEQALRVAKETYDKQPMYREWLEKMFPKLKESEDKKIRKDIKRAISVALDYSYFDKETANNCLAWLEKQGEQKSIETVKWSPQEESCICQLESLVKEQWRQAERVHNSVNIKKMSDLAFFLKTLNPNKKPSDEDMKTLLRTEYEKGRADAIAEMQKEWSEEDENMLGDIIEDVMTLHSGKTLGVIRNKINWLKSLRPQNRWKPSDEQMEALYTYIYNPQYFNSLDPRMELVESVYKDLKKLKEG